MSGRCKDVAGLSLPHAKGGGDVLRLLLDGQAGLGAGAAGADEDVRAADGIQARSNRLRKHLRLVVASRATAGPVERDGKDEVDIDKMRGGGEVAAEEGAVEAADGEVRVVLEGAGDVAVGAFVVQEGDGVGGTVGEGVAGAGEIRSWNAAWVSAGVATGVGAAAVARASPWGAP